MALFDPCSCPQLVGKNLIVVAVVVSYLFDYYVVEGICWQRQETLYLPPLLEQSSTSEFFLMILCVSL